MLKTNRCHVRAAAVALSALLLVVLAGCTPDHFQSTFDTSGPVARSQLALFYVIFWAAVFVFIVVGGILLYTTIRFRRKSDAEEPEQIHGHTRLEIGWTIAPILVLIVVAVPTVLTIFDNANSPDPDGLTVDAIGHQWWWEFRYPEYDLVTANELHIPVGEVVNVNLESIDVIHSFWIPKIAGKVDLVPNSPNFMWIEVDEDKPGEYFGQCAEFCGVAHAHMRFRVIAESREDFDAWVASQKEPAPTPTDPLAVEGHDIFMGNQAGCWSCHTVAGTRKARGTTGPNLTHVASRSHIASGILENTQANLRSWLEDPNKIKIGNIMSRDAAVYTDPAKRLSEPQISALVAYLRLLE